MLEEGQFRLEPQTVDVGATMSSSMTALPHRGVSSDG
jgi:hypothetical protein